MSEEYVTQVFLEINGQRIDFKTVTEGERELWGPVKLMNKTGHGKKLERNSAEVDYPIPSDEPEFDFSKVKGGTLTIDWQNGTRIKYTGVYTTKIGKAHYDIDAECVVKTIELSAAKRLKS